MRDKVEWVVVLMIISVAVFTVYGLLHKKVTNKVLPKFKVVNVTPYNAKVTKKEVKRKGRDKVVVTYEVVPAPIKKAGLTMYPEVVEFDSEVTLPNQVKSTFGIYRSPHVFGVGFGYDIEQTPIAGLRTNVMFLLGRTDDDKPVAGIGFGASRVLVLNINWMVGGMYSTMGYPEVFMGMNITY